MPEETKQLGLLSHALQLVHDFFDALLSVHLDVQILAITLCLPWCHDSLAFRWNWHAQCLEIQPHHDVKVQYQPVARSKTSSNSLRMQLAELDLLMPKHDHGQDQSPTCIKVDHEVDIVPQWCWVSLIPRLCLVRLHVWSDFSHKNEFRWHRCRVDDIDAGPMTSIKGDWK